MAKKDYQETVSRILEGIGGKDNVSFATHCVTRLRLNLRDRSLADEESIKNIPGVLGCQWSGEQFQVIIGQAVRDVYSEFCQQADLAAQAAVDENLDGKKKFSFAAVLDAFSGCVTPLIPILVGCGLIKIIVMVCEMTGILAAGMSTHTILTFVGDAGFYFLPVYAGFSAAQKFGGNPMLGALLGAILIHPTFVAALADGTPLSFLGLPVSSATYTSMIFPSIISVYAMSIIEKFVADHSPEMVRSITEPLITLLIMIPLMLCVTGPLGTFIGNAVTGVIGFVYDHLGFVGVSLLGAVFPFLVLGGMHMCAGMYALQSFMTIGYDPFVLIANFCANMAVGGACLAVALKSKNAERKSLGASFGVSALLAGVTEPAIFGMLTKIKAALISTMIGGAVGGAIAGIFKVGAYAFPGSAGFFGLPCFIGPTATNITMAAVSVAVSTVVSFAVCLLIYKED